MQSTTFPYQAVRGPPNTWERRGPVMNSTATLPVGPRNKQEPLSPLGVGWGGGEQDRWPAGTEPLVALSPGCRPGPDSALGGRPPSRQRRGKEKAQHSYRLTRARCRLAEPMEDGLISCCASRDSSWDPPAALRGEPVTVALPAAAPARARRPPPQHTRARARGEADRSSQLSAAPPLTSQARPVLPPRGPCCWEW